MNYTKIITAVLEIALLLFMTLIYPKLQKIISSKIGDEASEKLLDAVAVFVDAAQQVGNVLSYTGPEKKEYVIERLQEIGYEVTPTIDAYIEAAVFNMKGGI